VGRYKREEINLVDVNIDESDLLTMAEAAEMLGLTIPGVSVAVDRGRFTAIIDTEAPPRQGRRLLLRSEVEASLRERKAFETFEQKWEQATPAEDTTPLTDEEASAVVHEVREREQKTVIRG